MSTNSYGYEKLNRPAARIGRFLVLVLPVFLLVTSALAQERPRFKITLVGQMTDEGPAVEHGMEWRIFGSSIGVNGSLPLLASSSGGSRAFTMPAGEYLVYASYGHASVIRKIEVTAKSSKELFILNAGGMELHAVAGQDTPIAGDLLRFDVYEAKADERGQRRLLARRILPGTIIPFQEGTYHVVSQYGDLNAEVRADIRVSAGKLMKAELKHRAAHITLRLVRVAGGDALANTKWSVLNASGDLITESLSAFPRMVLSEGVYTAIANNGNQIYSHDFEVRSGINRDVEVLAGG